MRRSSRSPSPHDDRRRRSRERRRRRSSGAILILLLGVARILHLLVVGDLEVVPAPVLVADLQDIM